jgi:Cu/Ag efflux protein CusF
MDGRYPSGRRRAWGIAVGLAMSLAMVGLAGAGPSFDGWGRITAVDPGRGTVTIDHGGIAGLLPATESEFPVQTADVIQGVRQGDRVRFTLGVADESHGLLAVTSLTAEGIPSAGWFDRVAWSVTAVLALGTLAAVATVGGLLWRQLQSLHRRVVALDHEAGMLRGLVTDARDGVRQIAHALDEATTALRVGYVQELRRRLVPGSSPATVGTAGNKGANEAVGLVVIERGRGELYRAVERGAAGPGLTVIWDRRRTDRRRSARRPLAHERRRSERRGAPPETWTRLGFQLVPGGTAEVPRLPRVLRPASGERGTPR